MKYPSPNHSSRNGARVRLLVVHTAEGATTTASLGKYFSVKKNEVSSHVGIDDKSTEQYVDYDQAAWTVRSANAISENVELCGFAHWSRAEWMEHRPMLDRLVSWLRDRAKARGIPLHHLSPHQVAQGVGGIIGHVDWTRGMGDGTHTDPGPNFPWDYVMDRLENDMTPEEFWNAKYPKDGSFEVPGDGTVKHFFTYIYQIERRNADLAETVEEQGKKLDEMLSLLKAKSGTTATTTAKGTK